MIAPTLSGNSPSEWMKPHTGAISQHAALGTRSRRSLRAPAAALTHAAGALFDVSTAHAFRAQAAHFDAPNRLSGERDFERGEKRVAALVHQRQRRPFHRPSNRYYSAMRQVSHSVICSEAVGRRDTAMVLRFMAWSYGVSARDLAPAPVVISVGH